MRPGVINEDLDRLFQAVNEGCSKASGSGKPEAVLREHVQPVLGEALRNCGARATARNEAVLTYHVISLPHNLLSRQIAKVPRKTVMVSSSTSSGP